MRFELFGNGGNDNLITYNSEKLVLLETFLVYPDFYQSVMFYTGIDVKCRVLAILGVTCIASFHYYLNRYEFILVDCDWFEVCKNCTDNNSGK